MIDTEERLRLAIPLIAESSSMNSNFPGVSECLCQKVIQHKFLYSKFI